MEIGTSKLLAEVADYYSAKLERHGETPRGVDWNGEESQTLRFVQLCKIISTACDFSINDLGCGYGALLDHLQAHYSGATYTGYDISGAMICAARRRFAEVRGAQFVAVPSQLLWRIMAC